MLKVPVFPSQQQSSGTDVASDGDIVLLGLRSQRAREAAELTVTRQLFDILTLLRGARFLKEETIYWRPIGRLRGDRLGLPGSELGSLAAKRMLALGIHPKDSAQLSLNMKLLTVWGFSM